MAAVAALARRVEGWVFDGELVWVPKRLKKLWSEDPAAVVVGPLLVFACFRPKALLLLVSSVLLLLLLSR